MLKYFFSIAASKLSLFNSNVTAKLTLPKIWLNHSTVQLLFFSLTLIIFRLLRGPALEMDEAEQVAYAQHLLLGYPNQPPLYSWLQHGFFQIVGINLISLALLKYALIFGCIYYYYKICILSCPTMTAAGCATLAWVLIPVISFDFLKDNTHSVLALLTACSTWYYFIAPTRLAREIWYLRLGIIIGCGLLSKFNYLLFLSIFVVSALSIPRYRQKILTATIGITLFSGLLIVAPYGYWLIKNSDIGLHSAYKLVPKNKPPGQGLIELFKNSVFFAAPPLLLAFLFFSWRKKTARKDNNPTIKKTGPVLLLQRYHQLFFPILALILILLGAKDFKTRWLTPLLFACPLLYFSRRNLRASQATRYFFYFCLSLQFTFVLILIYRSYYKPVLIQEIVNIHFQ